MPENILPKTLCDIVGFLKSKDFSLSSHTRDGRLNSAFNEDEIFNLLEQNFSINRPNMRDWVDFSFEENNNFYPINIKVSTTKTADNLNCKLEIYYALTGKIPPFSNGVIWEIYFKNLNVEFVNSTTAKNGKTKKNDLWRICKILQIFTTIQTKIIAKKNQKI